MVKAFKMRLEYGMGPEYEKIHSEVLPEIENAMHQYGGSDCSIFLDERTGVLFCTIKIEDEKLWQGIGDDKFCRQWIERIAPTVRTNRENRPEATPLKLVFHID